MSTEYNQVLYIPNNIAPMPYNVQYVATTPQYQYLPKNELNTYVVNPPFYLEQKNFSDFVDCEISMEDNADISSNINSSYGTFSSRSRSPVSRMKNNPINAVYENKLRPRSPNIVRKNNFGLDNNSSSYESIQYSQNNSPLNRSNSLTNYSIQSHSYNNSPVITNNPIVSNISQVMPAQSQYIPENNNYNTNSNYKMKMYNSPVKKNKKNQYQFPKTLTKSTIYKNNNNSPLNNAERNVISFQYNPPLLNFAPVQNYQYLVGNPFLSNISTVNANNVTNLNNNNNYPNNNPLFNNNAQNIPQIYKSQYPTNNPNMSLKANIKENIPRLNIRNIDNNLDSNTSNKTFVQNNNKNPFSPIDQISLINSDCKINPNINELFKSCSNTHYSTSLLNNSNSRRGSSPNNLNVPGFDINKEIRNKSPSSLNANKNIHELKNNLTTINNKNNVALNNSPNSNLSTNNKNTGLVFNPQNPINNTKSNLYSKPSDIFSQYMFDQINKIRSNPRSYVDIFKKARDNIKQDKRGNLYYNGKIKVALYKGKEAFNDAITSLEKTKPMKPLLFKKDLCIEISNDKNDFKSGDYLRKKINELIKKDVKVRAFWRDIIKDAEINFLLMIVDDNPIRRGAKRNDVLNPEMKYIGINSGIVGENFVCYTVLSDE